ncbi:MAG TPA: hypothetical protein PK725_14680 [Rhodocyclaceae bacterium]|nr:hypothetical protein [Rhodocyclaceae bacterium]HRQ48197.1 hypothetical protein [Rhodocyclaceae bacterium]
MQRRDKITFAVLALVCVVPVVVSYLAFFVWQPEGRMNYGELIRPEPLPDATLAGLDGQALGGREVLKGYWTLVYVGPAACGAGCEEALFAMRQSRIAQRREMSRVERLWLVSDGGTPDAQILKAHDSLRVVRAAPAWLDKLPDADLGVHVYLVDPLGNVMMRFPGHPDVALVIRDLQRLLKFSGVG